MAEERCEYRRIHQRDATLLLPNLTAGSAGEYQVTASNTLGIVTSQVARLTVMPDLFGPTLVAASVAPSAQFGSNIIVVQFSEPLDRVTATNPANYSLIRPGSAEAVSITNALNNASAVQLRVSGTNWVLGADCVLTVNHVRDRAGAVIAPNSQIQVLWPRVLEVLPTSQLWRFHTAALFEPNIFDQDWAAPDFVESMWWSSGSGPFCAGPVVQAACFGPCATAVGFQPEPSLFRTSFVWPDEFSTNATLQIGHAIDDGAGVYLNGREILRVNLPTSPTPVTASTRALTTVATAACATNTVTVSNLVVGTNWLAVAVFQPPPALESDTIFALQMQATTTLRWELPSDPPSALAVSGMTSNRVAVSWTGHGFALESTTNLSSALSYPHGPWAEVTNMANPYVDMIADPQRFYRLRR